MRIGRLIAAGVAAAGFGLLGACADGSGPATDGSPNQSAAGTPTVGTSSAGATSASTASEPAASAPPVGPDGRPFALTEIGSIDEPWAMTFLPDGRALISSRAGRLLLRSTSGEIDQVKGTPTVRHAGQGGLGDVILAPDFQTSQQIYLSWAESGKAGTSGAVVGRARLITDADPPHLADLRVIWRQQPKVTGTGHYGHRLAFSPAGKYLFVSSGERQKFDPAQALDTNLGKILRLRPDGSPAPGNPYADRGGVTAEIWSYGHRNPLGLAFDADGRLWESEMGPMGGDEVNLIRRGRNYGWPKVSNGSHYDGTDIPDHARGDGYEAPQVWWNPSISPANLMIYSGAMFPQWRGDAFVGALSGTALIRLELTGARAEKADQWDLGERIREVEQAPDGAMWLLTDSGQILRLARPGS